MIFLINFINLICLIFFLNFFFNKFDNNIFKKCFYNKK